MGVERIFGCKLFTVESFSDFTVAAIRLEMCARCCETSYGRKGSNEGNTIECNARGSVMGAGSIRVSFKGTAEVFGDGVTWTLNIHVLEK